MWSSHTMRTVLTDTKTWTRAETRLGRRAARPLLVLGLAGIALAVVQAWCAALILGRVVAQARFDPALSLPYAPGAWLPLFGFTVAGLVRAAVNFASGVRAASVGADARRRLRSGALARVLAAGPALLRNRATGDLLTTLVDGIEGADGFYARWLPAASLASVGPALVLLAVLLADRRAALVLLTGGLAVPVFQAIFGIGAAAASRRQFTALSRLQNRFLDRIRGVSTIVLAGAAADEERALGRAADELRRRTMRVLRVAFLSSAALDCAQAACLVLIAVADRHLLLGHPTPWGAARAVFALLAVPEFFAPLRAFALAYQDRHRIAGAAGELASLPALPEVPAAPAAVRNVEGARRDHRVRGCGLHLGRGARPGAGRAVVPRTRRRDHAADRAFGCRQVDDPGDAARLRAARAWPHHHQRGRSRDRGAGGAVAHDGVDRPAAGAVRGHDAREHPVRAARRPRGGARGRRARGAPRRAGGEPAGGARDAGGRGAGTGSRAARRSGWRSRAPS